MSDSNLSASGINRKLTALDMEREALIERLSAQLEHSESKGKKRYSTQKGGVWRFLEDLAFVFGIVFITLNVILELARGVVALLQEVGYLPLVAHVGPPPTILEIIIPPLMEFLRASLLVVPKMLGKWTGGGIWTSIGSGIGRRIGGGKDDGTS